MKKLVLFLTLIMALFSSVIRAQFVFYQINVESDGVIDDVIPLIPFYGRIELCSSFNLFNDTLTVFNEEKNDNTMFVSFLYSSYRNSIKLVYPRFFEELGTCKPFITVNSLVNENEKLFNLTRNGIDVLDSTIKKEENARELILKKSYCKNDKCFTEIYRIRMFHFSAVIQKTLTLPCE